MSPVPPVQAAGGGCGCRPVRYPLQCFECGATCCSACAIAIEGVAYCRACAEALFGRPSAPAEGFDVV
jgi:hypothetical protein